MLSAQDYLNYVNSSIDIAPINSEEEYQAAHSIAKVMNAFGLEPQVEEFQVSVLSDLGFSILSFLMLVGLLITRISGVVFLIVGFVLAILPAVFSVLERGGTKLSIGIGPKYNSQNTSCVHQAEGSKAHKGGRKILVVAHYDTPRTGFLYGALRAVLPALSMAASTLVYVVALCAFLQLLVFIPVTARLVIWVVGTLCSLPALILAVGKIAEKFSACSPGVNDNKSSVAALLMVMGKLTEAQSLPEPDLPQTSEEDEEASEPEYAPEDADEDEEDKNTGHIAQERVRHGAEALREWGGVDDSTELSYDDDDPDATMLAPVDLFADDEDDATAGAVSNDAADVPSDDAGAENETGRFLKRSSLFDLPDPDGLDEDPFASDSNWKGGAARRGGLRFVDEPAHFANEAAGDDSVGSDDPIEAGAAADASDTDPAAASTSTAPNASDIDEYLPEDTAAEPYDTADVPEDLPEDFFDAQDAEVSDEEELRAAALSFDIEDLLAHEIRFVALGGSVCGHAGMRNYLEQHYSEVRGSFVINLDCVGAGTLTLLSSEGLHSPRKADRRMARLLNEAAKSLHISLESRPWTWTDTDAGPAMERHMRCATLMGLDESGMPAFSHSLEDEAHNVSPSQVARTADLVCELIRRS